MTLLILGLTLWTAGHLWNRFLPGPYAALGKAAYAVSAVVILASVVLMVVGYRAAAPVVFWTSPGWMIHVNNLLMVLAVFTYFATVTPRGTAFVVGNIRHPQLTGVKIWALAHLLVNGDLASVVLFVGLLAWAVLEVILINRQGEKFDRSKAPLKSPWAHLALAVVAFVAIAALHSWVGPWPFGG